MFAAGDYRSQPRPSTMLPSGNRLRVITRSVMSTLSYSLKRCGLGHTKNCRKTMEAASNGLLRTAEKGDEMTRTKLLILVAAMFLGQAKVAVAKIGCNFAVPAASACSRPPGPRENAAENIGHGKFSWPDPGTWRRRGSAAWFWHFIPSHRGAEQTDKTGRLPSFSYSSSYGPNRIFSSCTTKYSSRSAR